MTKKMKRFTNSPVPVMEESLFKGLLKELEDVYWFADDRSFELSHLMDEERFCKDCEYVEVEEDREEHFGFPCYRQYTTCPAEFTPGNFSCPKREEFEELEYEQFLVDQFMKAIDSLEEAYETLKEEGIIDDTNDTDNI